MFAPFQHGIKMPMLSRLVETFLCLNRPQVAFSPPDSPQALDPPRHLDAKKISGQLSGMM